VKLAQRRNMLRLSAIGLSCRLCHLSSFLCSTKSKAFASRDVTMPAAL
jgi:hypothetical protein